MPVDVPPQNDLFPPGVWHLRKTVVLALLLALGPGTARAAPVTAECPTTTTHTAGNRVECTEDNTSTDDISLDLDGVAISTEDANEDGIKATHAGGTSTDSADITIDVTGTSANNTISTTGPQARGIEGSHSGTGDVDIDVTGVEITTTNTGSEGIYGSHSGAGDVDIDATGVMICTGAADCTGTTSAAGLSLPSEGVEAYSYRSYRLRPPHDRHPGQNGRGDHHALDHHNDQQQQRGYICPAGSHLARSTARKRW